jgi:alpha-galactosidase
VWGPHSRAALFGIALLSLIAPRLVRAQSDKASIRFDQQTQVFRIDAADMSYVLGINEKKQVQTLYWGKRLSNADSFAAAHAAPGSSSFDLPINTTGQEFAAWGGGLYVEPDLKVTFPDGNRDLVLQYVSHAIEGNQLIIRLKDISQRSKLSCSIRQTRPPASSDDRHGCRIEPPLH